MTPTPTEITTADRIAMALGGALVVLGIVFSANLIALGFVVWTLYAVVEVLTRPADPVELGDGAEADTQTVQA